MLLKGTYLHCISLRVYKEFRFIKSSHARELSKPGNSQY